MQLDQAYQFKNPPCIHEVVDDEVIIINMEKGHYYNVKGVAKKVFVDLIAGIRPSELSQFNRWDKETEEKLGQFVEALIEENIIEIKKNVPDLIQEMMSPMVLIFAKWKREVSMSDQQTIEMKR